MYRYYSFLFHVILTPFFLLSPFRASVSIQSFLGLPCILYPHPPLIKGLVKFPSVWTGPNRCAFITSPRLLCLLARLDVVLIVTKERRKEERRVEKEM